MHSPVADISMDNPAILPCLPYPTIYDLSSRRYLLNASLQSSSLYPFKELLGRFPQAQYKDPGRMPNGLRSRARRW